jgi:hypothetical protein
VLIVQGKFLRAFAKLENTTIKFSNEARFGTSKQLQQRNKLESSFPVHLDEDQKLAREERRRLQKDSYGKMLMDSECVSASVREWRKFFSCFGIFSFSIADTAWRNQRQHCMRVDETAWRNQRQTFKKVDGTSWRNQQQLAITK